MKSGWPVDPKQPAHCLTKRSTFSIARVASRRKISTKFPTVTNLPTEDIRERKHQPNAAKVDFKQKRRILTMRLLFPVPFSLSPIAHRLDFQLIHRQALHIIRLRPVAQPTIPPFPTLVVFNRLQHM